MHMRKSAKNDNSVRESDRQELCYIDMSREKQTKIRKRLQATKKKITHYHIPITDGKCFHRTII